MKNLLQVLIFLSVVLAACGSTPTSTPTAAATATATETSTITETPTSISTATPTFTVTPLPVEYGPSNYPSGVDPLTGLTGADPALLERRPMVIKVQNIPRNGRPQWGLSFADIVFEYYAEEGATRFAAIFYGNDASMVGPIRSGRFIDEDIVRGYKAIFAFGYAYVAEMNRFIKSEFANRLVVEATGVPLTRYDPNGFNYLMVNTSDLSAYITKRGINGKQDLSGMSFKSSVPAGGQPATTAIVRFSGVIYNSWRYDSSLGKYLRFSDSQDDYNNQNEQYTQLTDRLTNQAIAFDNVVVLFADHKIYSTDSEGTSIYDIQLSGSGDAYAFRDGQAYKVNWQRNDTEVVSLVNPDGTPFGFKPGTTWFEVVGLKTTLIQTDQDWRFVHQMP